MSRSTSTNWIPAHRRTNSGRRRISTRRPGSSSARRSGARLTPSAKTIEELCALPSGDPGRAERIAALRQVEAPYAEVLALLDRASALDAAGWDDADRPRRQALAAMGPRSAGDRQPGPDRAARLHAATGKGPPSALLATLRLRRVLPPSFFGLLPVPDGAQPAVPSDA